MTGATCEFLGGPRDGEFVTLPPGVSTYRVEIPVFLTADHDTEKAFMVVGTYTVGPARCGTMLLWQGTEP